MLAIEESTLTQEENELYLIHADRFLTAMHEQLGGELTQTLPELALFLYRKRWELSDLQDRLGGARQKAGGFYFQAELNEKNPNEKTHGFAVLTEGLGVLDIYRVIQHECLHFFFSRRVGSSPPRWLDEGLAQYFEDGIFVDGHFRFGFADAARLMRCQAALRSGRFMHPDDLFKTTPMHWSMDVLADHRDVGLLYDQAWSIVWFLMSADEGRHRPTLQTYIQAIEESLDEPEPFTMDAPMIERWRDFVLEAEPDPLATTLDRMSIIASLLMMLKHHMARLPETAEECRLRMQIYGIKLFRPLPGGETHRINASDPALYCYMDADGLEPEFEMKPRAKRQGALPTLHATHAPHRPALHWRHINAQVVLPEIVFDTSG